MSHHERDTESTLRSVFDAFNERRFADYGAAFTQSGELVYPQSGERIVGRNRIVAVCEANPTPPTLVVRDVHVSGDLAVIESDERYDSGDVWSATSIFELDSGMISKATCYFGKPFEAAQWRKQLLE